MSNTQVPVTEIVWFPVKVGKQPTEGQENMFGVDAGPGFLGGRFGWQLENKNVFHWVMSESSFPLWFLHIYQTPVSDTSQTGHPTMPTKS